MTPNLVAPRPCALGVVSPQASPTHKGLGLLLVAAWMLSFSAAAVAQSADPDNVGISADAEHVRKTSADHPYTGQNVGEIRRNEDNKEPDVEESESPLIPGAGALVKMLLWLGLVVVLIYGGVYLFRRYVPSARNMFGGGALKIIGRTYLGPKTCILLVKVGSRLVMVGITGNTMSALTEITTPAEVTAITNELASSGGVFGGSFSKTLDRRQEEITSHEFRESTEVPQEPDEGLRDMRDELENITEKMNWWRKTAAG